METSGQTAADDDVMMMIMMMNDDVVVTWQIFVAADCNLNLQEERERKR